VQLLALVLYNADGRTRRIDFMPGQLNIITGESGTGKSALLTIVEYCLGRNTNLVPVGPISDTVEWYAALWQLDDAGARAFVARPKPAGQNASTAIAMLEFGNDLEPPPLEELRGNTDTRQLRQQLGRRLGIEENQSETGPWSLRQGLEANIGHAALLCLQAQSEVASQSVMFHRMGEDGIDQALRDTIPYFLGAVAPDEARKRAQLRDAKRTLARLEAEYERAQQAAQTIDVQLGSLYAEARAVGLLEDVDAADRSALVRALQGARAARPTDATGADGPAEQDRRRTLEQRRDALGQQLRLVMESRGLLLNESKAANDFVSALAQQESRLTSLNLLPPLPETAGEHTETPTVRPVGADWTTRTQQLRYSGAAWRTFARRSAPLLGPVPLSDVRWTPSTQKRKHSVSSFGSRREPSRTSIVVAVSTSSRSPTVGTSLEDASTPPWLGPLWSTRTPWRSCVSNSNKPAPRSQPWKLSSTTTTGASSSPLGW